MGTDRITRDAGWINRKARPRGPNGRGLCRQCGQEVPKGRQTFCNAACVHEWKLRSNPGYVRAEVFKRDRGVCASCGLDTVVWGERLKIRLEAIWQRRQEWWRKLMRPRGQCPGVYGWRKRLLMRIGGKALAHRFYRTTNLWDADHIVPVAEGGGGCGLENYRTLCLRCHRRATHELRARLKTRR